MKISNQKLNPYVAEKIHKISTSRSLPSSLVQRAKIIKLSCHKMTILEIARKVSLDRRNVGKWRKRFLTALPKINALAEENHFKECRNLIIETLSDKKRSGRPAKFSTEQKDTVISIACTKPESWNWPLSQWSHSTLAMFLTETLKVTDISASTVQRILKKHRVRPHKWEMWIQPTDKDYNPYIYLKQVRKCSRLLQNIESYYQKGIQIISIDEKSGIQILKPHYKDKEAQMELNPKREVFYQRLGRLDLIQATNLYTGELFNPFIEQRHRETEFVQALESCINEQLAQTPEDEIIILCDNFPTHKSEGVVRLIARYLKERSENLGMKGIYGILKDKKSREEFLIDESHRIRFVFTPRHASWLNPIECYFSILNRHLLDKLFPESVPQAKETIEFYSSWYNEHFARPFSFKFSGFEEKLDLFEKQLTSRKVLLLPPPNPSE